MVASNFVPLFLSLTTFFGALFINFLTGPGIITPYRVDEISNKYPLQITPASWTFSIWGIIYIWQCLWLLYVLKRCIFDGNQLFDLKFYISFIASNILNLTWLIAWCNNRKILAGILLTFLTLSLYECNWSCLSSLYTNNHAKIKNEKIRSNLNILVNNGIACYATWASIATCLNWGMVMNYDLRLGDPISSFIALFLLTIILTTYFIMDLIFNHEYFMHLWSPLFVLMISFTGILVQNGIKLEQPTSVAVISLLILSIIGYIVKYNSISKHTKKAQLLDKKK